MAIENGVVLIENGVASDVENYNIEIGQREMVSATVQEHWLAQSNLDLLLLNPLTPIICVLYA